MKALCLLLALAAPPRPGTPAEPPPAGAPSGAASDEGRTARAAALLADGDDGRARLVAEARGGPAAARRAALLALATLPGEGVPPGTLEAGLEGLASPDPLLRAAAVRALLACGTPAARALEGILAGTPVAGLPEPPRGRAADALADLRRQEIEREFLATWTSEDGTFHGMYAHLKRHGAFGAKVLAAIALDRRMAGTSVLSFGPYAWFVEAAGARDRSEVRGRALDALADAGDAAAREMLRPCMREDPAPELYDDGDTDPIPAGYDDSLREAIAALGDAEPLRRMIEASESVRHGGWSRTVEMRRRAGAYAVLGQATPHEAIRVEYFNETESLLRRAIAEKARYGMAIDGVEYYNLACALARRDRGDDRKTALGYLERAVRTYAVSASWVERDGDLASLRGEPRFRELVQRMKEREQQLRQGLPPVGK